MTTTPDPHFDHYAHVYRDLHRDSVRASGEPPDYFAAYKIAYMAASLGSDFAAKQFALLDFGCGVGGSMPHLRERFPQADIHGLDVSGESLELARQAHPDVSFALLGEGRLPLADHSVDVAMAACVYHHIAPAERAHWTRELRRVLRPGGHLFLFEHNPLNPLTRKVVRDCPFDDDAILLPRHESLGLFLDAGLKDVMADYIVFFPKVVSFMRPLEKYLGKVPLGAQYVVHGRG
jgi:ubiquinone/menaquinone biosynthesis C-methylase UbiE